MAAKIWDDFLLRTNTSDTGVVPGPGPASGCPDIIPNGIEQVADPQATFSANYGSDVGKSIIANTINAIFLRSKNLAPATNSGEVSLFWTNSSYILWPYAQGNVKTGWSENIIVAADGKDKIEISAEKEGDIAVTPRPFLWNPPQPPVGTHYCLLAGVATTEHPQIIPELNEVTTGGEFATWVLNHRNVGWRNVATTDSGAASASRLDDFQNGTTAQEYTIQILCSNCPVGWEVELKTYNVTDPAPVPPIDISKKKITDPVQDGFFVESLVPPNYYTLLALNIYMNGIQPDSRWDITVSGIVKTAETGAVDTAGIPIYEAVVIGGVEVNPAM